MIRTGMLDRVTESPALLARSQNGPGLELYSARPHARICRIPPRTQPWLGRLFALLAVVLGPVATGAAQAKPRAQAAQAPAEADALTQAARSHFEAAMQHYRARRYREAIHEFEQSAARVPNAALWFDVGRAHEQLGEYGLAIDSYQRYLRDRVDAPDAEELTRHIASLTDRAQPAAKRASAPRGSIAIDASQPGALVLLDGRQLGIAPIDRVLDVEPGPHRLEASHPGYVPFRARVDVQEGALSAAYVDMRPLTRARAGSAPRLWTWIAAGASAAALLTAGACGAVGLAERDDGNAASAQHWIRASDIALGSALTLAVGATLLYFIEGDRTTEHASSTHELADVRR
jgi:tetratricopeptide (TPR) repeat protein